MRKKSLSFIIIIILIFTLPLIITIKNSKSIETSSNLTDTMKVHFINVGQGDSILISVNNKNLLIDSGPRSNEKDFFNYLKSIKLNKLDYVIATHPHEDHIGNMDTLIKKYPIETFLAPKVTANTKSFEDMIEALIDKNLKIIPLKAGNTSIDLGPNTKVTVFSPNKDTYTNENNYSPIIKIQFYNTSFLLTGDAESIAENEVLSQNFNIESDVIKIGHHGSNTSTSDEFFKSVNPSIAVISCGKYNQYNHPSAETKQLLKKYNTKTYRTDLDGTIVLESNGYQIRRVN